MTVIETKLSTKTPVHADMPQFPTREGELQVGGMPLSRLAARVGQTPFYAYDRQALRERATELRHLLPAGVKLHYAMKANPMPAVVGLMAGLLDGIDVASAGELKVALDAGADPQEISFAGPGKRDAELRQAVASGVLVNIESLREVRLLGAIATELGLPARVAVRVNPDFELKGSGMKMGGGPKQFGVDVEQMPELMAARSPPAASLSRASTSSPVRRTCGPSRSAKPSRSPMNWHCVWPISAPARCDS